MSAFVRPFDTWASMPHLIDAEQWVDSDGSQAVLSGLQAANAVLARARNHRVTPYDLG